MTTTTSDIESSLLWKRLKRTADEISTTNNNTNNITIDNDATTSSTALTLVSNITPSTTTTTVMTTSTPSLLSFSNMNNNNNNNSITHIDHTSHIKLIHQQNQIDTIQMQLNHERDTNKIEIKKLNHIIQKLQQQLIISNKDIQQLNNINNDIQQQNNKQINDLMNAKNQAQQLNRQYQLELEQLQYLIPRRTTKRKDYNQNEDQDDDDDQQNENENENDLIEIEIQKYQLFNQQLQEQINDYKKNEILYQNEINTLKHTVQDKLQSIQNITNQQQNDNEMKTNHDTTNKLYEDAPKTLLQELNSCRIQLSTREREMRQLQRKYTYQTEQYNILLKEKETLLLQNQHYPTIQKELHTLHSKYTIMEAENLAYKEFIHEMNQIMKQKSKSKSSSRKDGDDTIDTILRVNGPPEIATILRYIQEMSKRTTSDDSKMKSSGTKGNNELHLLSSQSNDTIDISKTKKQHDDYEQTIQQLQQKYDTIYHQMTLYQREINSYKELIQTYEQQQIYLFNTNKGNKNTNDTTTGSSTSINPTNSNMNIKYDTLLIEYKSLQDKYDQLEITNQQMNTDLQSRHNELKKLQTEYDHLLMKYQQIKDGIKLEKERRIELEQQVIKAEQLAGKGSFDAEQTRVLHYKETPLVCALKEEISVLKRQIDSLLQQRSVSLSSSPDTNSLLDTSILISSTSNTTGSTTLPNPEKVIQRLKEQFKEQIGLFREGVYIMTGYKIDMITTNSCNTNDSKVHPTFRLRSVFAENEDDQLLLQWSVNNTNNEITSTSGIHTSTNNNNTTKSFDILQTDFAKYLSTTPSYEYISKLHNLPAFLASVQLSLFEKQTIIM